MKISTSECGQSFDCVFVCTLYLLSLSLSVLFRRSGQQVRYAENVARSFHLIFVCLYSAPGAEKKREVQSKHALCDASRVCPFQLCQLITRADQFPNYTWVSHTARCTADVVNMERKLLRVGPVVSPPTLPIRPFACGSFVRLEFGSFYVNRNVHPHTATVFMPINTVAVCGCTLRLTLALVLEFLFFGDPATLRQLQATTILSFSNLANRCNGKLIQRLELHLIGY